MKKKHSKKHDFECKLFSKKHVFDGEHFCKKHNFEMEIFRLIRFWIECLSSFQYSNQLFYNASDFELKFYNVSDFKSTF